MTRLLFSLHLAFAFGAALIAATGSRAADTDVRVMSFNIRYGTARDGINHWDQRKTFVVETIRAFNPDLLGTQETLGFQRDFLAAELKDYDVLGVGRDDGDNRGEMMSLYFRRERFEKLDGGHFWLSETPAVVGSRSWDAALPRMVTWVKLKDRRRPDAPPVCCFNTHFDHQGATARRESSAVLLEQISRLAADASVVVTGDFNAAEGSPPYQVLFPGTPASRLVDSFRTANPDRREDEGTFTGFNAASVTGARIDWIGVSRDWQIRSARIDRTARDGRTPSDHFPVTAVLRHSLLRMGNRRSNPPPHVVSEPQYKVRTVLDIPYHAGRPADRRKHQLDLYLPVRDEQFPVVFFIHGGAWTTGDRKLYSLLGRAIARHGVGAVVISYRLSPGVKHPEHIRDVAAAFQWTHRHIAEYGGRPDQIVVSGQSAGGHLAALLATDESYLREQGLSLGNICGVVPISGIFRFKPGTFRRVIGSAPDAAFSASPTEHVSGDEPPFLILYADSDIPPCAPMSEELVTALQAKQVQAGCEVIPGRNHLTVIFQPMFDWRDPTLQRLLKFTSDRTGFPLNPPVAEPAPAPAAPSGT